MALQILLLVVLLTCQHNPMRTTSSLKELFQSALSFILFFQLFILNSYYLKNGQLLSNILFRPNPFHTYTSHFLKIHCNSYRSTACEIHRSIVTLSSHLRLILPSGHFPPVSTPKSRTSFSHSHTRYMTHQIHSSRF